MFDIDDLPKAPPLFRPRTVRPRTEEGPNKALTARRRMQELQAELARIEREHNLEYL